MKLKEVDALHTIYVGLLRLPHGALRQRLQSMMATIRDEIAAHDGFDPETVQTSYETLVTMIERAENRVDNMT